MERFIMFRRDPFVIWTLCFFILSCSAALVSGTRPGTVESLLPPWYWYGWLVVILVSSLLYVYGIFTRNLLNGLFIIWSTGPIIAISLVAIGAAQLIVGGPKALISCALLSGLGMAFLAQRRTLSKVIATLPKKNGKR